MNVTPLAADSLGARSMATRVETGDVTVVIDPSVRLAPRRYDLPPHEVEEDRQRELWRAIREAARTADILTVSHYHYDHHNPDAPSIFRRRVAYLKDPAFHINRSQRERASAFRKAIAPYARETLIAEGTTVDLGNTTIRFSPALPHGFSDELGYVVMVYVEDSQSSFLHSSDVEGPPLKSQLSWILSQNPDVLYIDGPMTHMPENFPEEQTRKSIANLRRIVQSTDVGTVILDHHALRDPEWRERMGPVYRAGEEHGVRVTTAAEFAGRPLDPLEYRRDELHGLKP